MALLVAAEPAFSTPLRVAPEAASPGLGGAFPVQALAQGLAGQLGDFSSRFPDLGSSGLTSNPAALDALFAPATGEAPAIQRDAALALASALAHPQAILPVLRERLSLVATQENPAFGRELAARIEALAASLDAAGRQALQEEAKRREIPLFETPSALFAVKIDPATQTHVRSLEGLGSQDGRVTFDQGRAGGGDQGSLSAPTEPAQSAPRSSGLFPARLLAALRQAQAKAEPPQLSPRAESIVTPYTRGQYWSVLRFAAYFPFFTAVMNRLGGMEAVRSGRGWFAGIQGLFGSISPVLAKRFPIHRLLMATTGLRVLIWAVLMPVLVGTLSPGLVTVAPFLLGAYVGVPLAAMAGLGAAAFAARKWKLGPGGTLAAVAAAALLVSGLPMAAFAFSGMDLFRALLATLMIADGFVVTFSQALGLDAAGLSELARQHGFENEITEKELKYYGTRYETWYFRAQAFFPPAIGLLALVANLLGLPVTWAFMGLMAVSFIAPGVMEILNYRKIPAPSAVSPERSPAQVGLEVAGGIKILWTKIGLSSRIILGMLERSVWEGLRLIAFPMFGLKVLGPALGLGEVWGAYLGVLLLALSNFAGALSATATNALWQASSGGPPQASRYRVFFNLMFLAGLTTLAIPLAQALIAGGFLAAGILAAAAAAFLFSLFFQSGRIGLRILKQQLAAREPSAAQVFGVSEALDLFFNVLAIAVLTLLFERFPGESIGTAFWLTSGFFAAVLMGFSQLGRWLNFIPSKAPHDK